MVCPNCGTELIEPVDVCGKCGYHLSDSAFLTTKNSSKTAKNPKWPLYLILPSIIVIGLLLSFDYSAFLRTHVVEGRIIPSGSMLPTIQIQDRVMVSKGAYLSKEPAFGDIIIFKPPDELGMKDEFIKRVIGLPRDTIDIKQGKVYRNGKALNEPYIMEAPNYEYGPAKVPADSLFVMGDNRNQSYDSHLWNGWVTMDHVKGKVTSIYWPISHRKSLD